MRHFSLVADLPSGTTVLEASAGSGKTYAIVGLATRYVAEGLVELSQLMLVTFGRAATQELRERTRERFTFTAHALGDVPAARQSPDELVRFLAAGTSEQVAARRARLRRALSDFDAATIATTHSFCQRMLDGLGIAGEREPNVTLVEAVDELREEVVEDLYLATYGGYDAIEPRLKLSQARDVTRDAVSDRQALLVPADASPDTEAGQLYAFAQQARVEVERRKRTRGMRDFDDLLVLLRDTLADPEHGPSACERIQSRYSVVLVDEFQDTDPVQWEILRRAFHGSTTLILVGDPKQAIYAFRGAEVLSYLDAVTVADHHQELTTNWRTDAGLIAALEHLYGGTALGHPQIVVHPVTAAHAASRLAGETPLRLRYLPRTGAGVLYQSGFPTVDALRTRVADDVAADIVRLLERAPVLTVGESKRPVEPGDIAVLVRRGTHVGYVHAALERAGVPSVLAGGTSVFETPSATDWLWMLQALEQPHRADRARLAALTPLLGWTAVELAAAGDDAVSELTGKLRAMSTLFADAGFAAVFEELSADRGLERRLLGVLGGERRMTDLRHLAQLLNRAAVEESLGISALTRWLSARVLDPSGGTVRDRSRRLDSDGAAVQIVTVHASKGLEFPVVYVPFGWDGARNPNPSTLLLHGPSGERILDIGGKNGPGWRQRQKTADTEAEGEELRLIYVALTRAMCQVVLWWAPASGARTAPLHRLLMGRTTAVAEPALSAPVPEDAAVTRLLQEWATGAPIAVEAVGATPIPSLRWAQAPVPSAPLSAASFNRSLDEGWRRTSYSALTASVHDAHGVSSEAEEPEKTDEPDEEPVLEVDLGGIPSPMNDLPSGAAFGTLVHEVLEVVDTQAPDLVAELERCCRLAVARRMAPVDPTALAAALVPVMRTPLGFGTLATIVPSDRLAELDFEIPLAGGDDPASDAVTLKGIAALLREHLPSDDPLVPYADLLETVDAPDLRGYLSGSIDVVLRIDGPRYVIVDYKTNRLAAGDLTVAHYTRAAMAAEMVRAHYPLQALIYSVALHRYLRWRQPGYEPAVHLGGTQYQFVRGMVGPETPAGHGVFDWTPPPELVVAISDLLAGSGD